MRAVVLIPSAATKARACDGPPRSAAAMESVGAWGSVAWPGVAASGRAYAGGTRRSGPVGAGVRSAFEPEGPAASAVLGATMASLPVDAKDLAVGRTRIGVAAGGGAVSAGAGLLVVDLVTGRAAEGANVQLLHIPVAGAASSKHSTDSIE